MSVPIKGRRRRRRRCKMVPISPTDLDEYGLKSLEFCRHNANSIERVRKWIRGQPRKSLLVTGPPGCGKTRCIRLIIEAENCEMVYYNGALYQVFKAKKSKKTPSESHGRDNDDPRRIENSMFEASRNRNVLALLRGETEPQRRIIVLDQVDQFVSGSGCTKRLETLVNLLKTHQIIMIANSTIHKKMRTIQNYCTETAFKKPNDVAMGKILEDICDRFELKLSIVAKNLLVTKANGDINQLLLLLYGLRTSTPERKQITLNQVMTYLNTQSEKYMDDDNVFSCTERLLVGKTLSMERKLQLFDMHTSQIPLMLQTNMPYGSYLGDDFDKINKALEWFCQGDLFESSLEPERMDKELYIDRDLYAMYSTIGPLSLIEKTNPNSKRPRRRKLEFSKLYGCENTRRSKQRKLNHIRSLASIEMGELGSIHSVSYMGMILANKLEAKAYDDVAALAKVYGFRSHGEDPKAVAETLFEIAYRFFRTNSTWKKPTVREMKPLIQALDRK